jgi:hypothetical protein
MENTTNNQETASTTDQPSETPQQNTQMANSIEEAISQIDITKITADDVFMDLINKSKMYSYALMIAAALLEKIIINNRSEEQQTEQNPEDQAVS